MKMQITPYVGIGPIRFGMSRAEARAAMGAPVREFKKTPNSAIPTDAFPSLGVHIYYKAPDVCEAIEVASPADPILFGKQLLGQRFDSLCEWFRNLDNEVKVDEVGLTSLLYGVGFYAPSLKSSPSTPIEAVIVFERGYYD
jgi:hypothetical protein